MKWIITKKARKEKALAAMNDFHQWLLNMNNIYIADTKKMSEAYQKVYQSSYNK